MSAECVCSVPPAVHTSLSATPVPLSDNSDLKNPNKDACQVLGTLREVTGRVPEPSKQEGFLLKRRKWPMKGWHKRYFLLDKGFLMYSKTLPDLTKRKVRGRIDVGLSVMSIKKKTMCIDLDTGHSIYHLKVKSRDTFDDWVSQLRNHREFRQNEIIMEPRELLHSGSASIRKRDRLSNQPSQMLKNTLLQNSEDMKKCYRDLSNCESSLLELNLLLKNLEAVSQLPTQAASTRVSTRIGTRTESPKKKMQRKWRSRAHSKNGKSMLRASASHPSRLHVSNPNLTHDDPRDLDTPDSAIDASRLQGDFCDLANSIHATLRAAYSVLSADRDMLRPSLDLKCMHDVCDERGSTPESLSEFFDANEYLLSTSSSENEVSDNDSCVSDVSDNVSEELCENETGTVETSGDSSVCTSARRSQLPSVCVSSGVNLWRILSSNIGKDLSKVSMPVQINEPINTLQRLCEEMEYCHLLDTAAHTSDPHMRMVYVAAFAVSAYACTYRRAGGKPFNPVLGETYECQRLDKGFRFISEQVSHHPPVSACHCESKNFTLWQDVQWKNKFWGKSMEIVPMGTTHIVLPRFEDHYELSRVTSCIHNILSGERWIEHYGDMIIRNTSATEDPVLCKVTFLKSRTRASSSNDVQAAVTDSEGRVIHSLFGKWNEAMYLGDPPSAICLWRANPLPQDYEKYYGFTQFTIELNELDESIRPFLPLTDTRFRPDQRRLEEGDIAGAEEQKERIEALQRERRRVLQENDITHTPRFFKHTEDDSWISNGTYWVLRKDPGFSTLECPVLW